MAGLYHRKAYFFHLTSFFSDMLANVENSKFRQNYHCLGSTGAIQTSSNKSKNWNKSASLFMSQISQFLTEDPAFQEENSVMSVSLRQAFVCSEGCLILAADYSQLELRILAHLSQDAKLMQILGPQNPGKYFISSFSVKRHR